MRDRLRRWLRWLVPTGNVAERTIKSGIWASITKLGTRALQVLLLVVLARLLDPADFGLMGIALLTIATMKRLTNLGIDEALIQKAQDDVDGYLDTVFTLEVARGLVISGVVVLAAPLVASFFGEPRATDVVRLAGLSPLVLSLKNPGIVYFQKDLEFHKETVYRLSYSGTRFAVGVVYALLSPTVWALVVSFIVADVVRVGVSYLIHGYRPWPAFSLERARDLVSYGKWITGGSILYFIYSQGDDAVVGWLLSATALGFYQLAYELGLAPGKQISGIVRRVMFPSYSQLQEDMGELRDAFFRTLQIVTFLGFPAAVGIAVVTPPFVRAFLGSAWTPMTTTMQLLAVYGLVLTVTNTYSPVWKALDRPDFGTKLAAVRVVLIAVLIVPMTSRFGIEGAAMTVVGITVFPMLPLDSYIVVNILDSSYTRLATELFFPALASAVMGVSVLAVQGNVAFGSPFVEFVASVAVGALSYALVVAVMATRSPWTIDRSLRSVVDTVR